MHTLVHTHGEPIGVYGKTYRDAGNDRAGGWVTFGIGDNQVTFHVDGEQEVRDLIAKLQTAADAMYPPVPTVAIDDEVYDVEAVEFHAGDRNNRGCPHVDYGQGACRACYESRAGINEQASGSALVAAAGRLENEFRFDEMARERHESEDVGSTESDSGEDRLDGGLQRKGDE